MPRPYTSTRTTLAVIAGLGLLTAIILAVAPAERTIGDGIRYVYLHVALTWAGMAAWLAAALVGLLLAASGQRRWARWAYVLGWVGFLFYLAGTIVSLPAQIVNWGGIAWREPRTAASLQALALAAIVLVLASWPISIRLKGGLYLLLAGYVFWTTGSTPLVLHPRDPIRPSPSTAIQLTFYSLFGVWLLAAGWLTAYWQARPQK